MRKEPNRDSGQRRVQICLASTAAATTWHRTIGYERDQGYGSAEHRWEFCLQEMSPTSHNTLDRASPDLAGGTCQAPDCMTHEIRVANDYVPILDV
jgi:hypothetical protein